MRSTFLIFTYKGLHYSISSLRSNMSIVATQDFNSEYELKEDFAPRKVASETAPKRFNPLRGIKMGTRYLTEEGQHVSVMFGRGEKLVVRAGSKNKPLKFKVEDLEVLHLKTAGKMLTGTVADTQLPSIVADYLAEVLQLKDDRLSDDFNCYVINQTKNVVNVKIVLADPDQVTIRHLTAPCTLSGDLEISLNEYMGNIQVQVMVWQAVLKAVTYDD